MLQKICYKELLLGRGKMFRSHHSKPYLRTRNVCAMAPGAKQQQEQPDVRDVVAENLKVILGVQDSSIPQQELIRAEKTLGNHLENMSCS